MKDKLTIKELAEFINGRDIAESATEGVFLTIGTEDKPLCIISGNAERIIIAIANIVAHKPEVAELLLEAIKTGMYHKGYTDAQGETTKGFEV